MLPQFRARPLFKRPFLVALGTLAAVSVVACGGGGGGGSTIPSIAPPTTQPAGTTTAAPSSAPVGTATAAPSSIPAGYARASFSITLPNASGAASLRRSQAVGAGTQSITFTLLEAGGSPTTGTPQTFPLTSTAPGCTASPTTGALTCILNVNAPIGLDVFLAQTYATTTGTGQLTGSGAVQLDVALNSANTASLSLTSQAQSVYLTASSQYLGAFPNYNQSSKLRQGASAVRRTASGGTTVNSMRVFVIALDSSGNTILNPSLYSTPLSLQLVFSDANDNPLSPGVPDVTLSVAYSSTVDPNGCSGNASTSTSFGTVQVCSPADVVTATFDAVTNGSPFAAIIGSVGATGYFPVPPPGATPSPFPTSTPANVGFIYFPVTTQTSSTIAMTDYDGNAVTSVTSLALGTTTLPYNVVYLNDSGATANFTIGGNCSSIASLNAYNYYTGYGYLYINPIAAGICTATISDGTNTVSLPITVTTTSLVGN